MRKQSYIFVIIIALAFVLIGFTIKTEYDNRCEERILVIRVHLNSLRDNIKHFFKQNGRYPNSLNEYLQYAQAQNQDKSQKIKLYVDLSSKETSEIPEYRELNDKGGYYYDPNNGVIRLNLTRPVKEYLKWYRGELKDEIPSTW